MKTWGYGKRKETNLLDKTCLLKYMKRREFVHFVSVGGGICLSGCSGSPDSITFEIDYGGSWSGSVGTGGNVRSISGVGPESIDMPSDANVVSGNAQKRDDDLDTLTVRIVADGDVVEEASTSSQYGVAQISHSFWFSPFYDRCEEIELDLSIYLEAEEAPLAQFEHTGTVPP